MTRRRAIAVAATTTPAVALLALYLLGAGWISGTALHDQFAIRGTTQWHTPWRVLTLLPYSAGLTAHGKVPWGAYLAVIAALTAGAMRIRREQTVTRGWPWLGPVLCALWCIALFALPVEFRGQSISPRLASAFLLALLWLLPVRPPASGTAAGVLGPTRIAVALGALVSLLSTHRAFARFDRAARPLDRIMAKIPFGSRVATLVYDLHPPGMQLPAFLHVGGYVHAARGGLASSGFTRTGVTYRPWIPRSVLTVDTMWRPSRRGWQMDLAHHGPYYDFVLVKTGRCYSGSPFIHASAPGWRAEPIVREGGFELWKISRQTQDEERSAAAGTASIP